LGIITDFITILLGWEIVSISAASGIEEETTATSLFVKVGSQYVSAAISLLQGFAANLLITDI